MKSHRFGPVITWNISVTLTIHQGDDDDDAKAASNIGAVHGDDS